MCTHSRIAVDNTRYSQKSTCNTNPNSTHKELNLVAGQSKKKKFGGLFYVHLLCSLPVLRPL